MKKRVLLIEDEEGLLVSLLDRLRGEGYDAHGAHSGEVGYEMALRDRPHLILLDVRLPGMDGFEVCRKLRQRAIDVPILILTARGQLDDRVLGLKVGADDYLVKPFETVELLARMEALLRRAERGGVREPEVFEFGKVRIDLLRDLVTQQHTRLSFLPMEYKLLRYFIQYRDVTLSRHRLLDEVWGYDAMPTTRTVDVHVAGIRQKIEPDPRRPRHLLTVHRRGYKFVGGI